MKKFVTLLCGSFLFSLGGLAAHEAAADPYINVSSAIEVLPIIRNLADTNALLIGPRHVNQHGQRNIEIYRGAQDLIIKTAYEDRMEWSSHPASINCLDFSKKPPEMSIQEFMQERKIAYRLEWGAGVDSYELRIDLRSGEVTLQGKGVRERRDLTDGSILFLLDSKTNEHLKSQVVKAE